MNGLLIGAITVAVVLALALLWRVVARRRRGHRVAAARAEADRQQATERERLEDERVRDAAERAAREAAESAAGEWKKEEKRRRDQLEGVEKRLEERRGTLDRKYDLLDRKEREILEREANLKARAEELEQRAVDLDERGRNLQKRLEEVAGLSAQDARRRLAREQEEAARAEAANTVRELREQAKRDGEREARNIIALSIQRIAADHTAESTVSVVTLPSDEMKGRIIGREGRNIRAFEQATGIDVVIDDTPEAVILSGFDPVRREVARISLEKLIEDGRIHPGRIEEVVEDSRGDVGKAMVEAAEEVLYEIGVHGVHPEIVKVLGRLKFRTSYGQNQLLHSKEVALLAGNMAMEMDLDADMARRMGILHDVGKGRTHEHEGTHVELGYRLCKKHDEPDQVLNAIRAHHDEEPHRYPETFLVTAADAISGARPGARREMFETYVRRLERLEEIARDFPGVERCFAIQAGREVRIMVDPEHVNDTIMSDLSERVARRLEEELQYPGQIKVVVIRETRAVDFAR